MHTRAVLGYLYLDYHFQFIHLRFCTRGAWLLLDLSSSATPRSAGCSEGAVSARARCNIQRAGLCRAGQNVDPSEPSLDVLYHGLPRSVRGLQVPEDGLVHEAPVAVLLDGAGLKDHALDPGRHEIITPRQEAPRVLAVKRRCLADVREHVAPRGTRCVVTWQAPLLGTGTISISTVFSTLKPA